MARSSVVEFFRQCRVLELEVAPASDELTRAYRRLIAKWHPDRHHGDPQTYDRALERAKAINAAYEYLSEVIEAGLAPTPGSQAQASTDGMRPDPVQTYETRHTYQGRTYETGFPDPAVVEIFVKSSNIVSVGYDAPSRVLYIKFHGGRVYRYFDVPRSIVDEFLHAPSHGKFANGHIYHRFQYERC